MNTEATLLTGKVETPKRALALQLGLAVCGLTALVAALATPRASGPQATGLRGAADANLATFGHELAAEPLAQLVEARAAATRRKSSPAAALISRKRAEASECADCPLLSSRF